MDQNHLLLISMKQQKQNNTYRTALWTGKHLQVTLMSINVGEDIGLEIHPNVDQFYVLNKVRDCSNGKE